MDKTEAQKVGDGAADVAPKVEDADKPVVEKNATKAEEATDGGADGEKKKDDEPVAAATATASNDDDKATKENAEKDAEKGAKTDDAPPTEGNATAAETKPAAENTTENIGATDGKPDKPKYFADKPALSKLCDELHLITERAGHSEMWGVNLTDYNDVPTVNVLIKFLRANEGDTKLAMDQLCKALEWRKKMDPLTLAQSTRFNKEKFQGLGYVSTYQEGKEIFTWNIYGAVKDINKTFGDIDE